MAGEVDEKLSEQFRPKENVAESPFDSDISGLSYDILSSADIAKCSSVRIVNSEKYMEGKLTPMQYGVLDLRLGANRAERGDRNRCLTCGGTWSTCSGHWGYVPLELPLFHVGYFKHLLNILYCICKSCSRVLLSELEWKHFQSLMKRKASDTIGKKSVFKKLILCCKKRKICNYCDAPQGVLKKLQKPTPEQFMKIYHTVKVKDGSNHLITLTDDLDPVRVRTLLTRISALDCEVLDITHPEKLVISTLLVPPASIRPSTTMGDEGTNEDDVTIVISDIVELNNAIKKQVEAGIPTPAVIQNWETMQLHMTRLINSDTPQLAGALLTKNISRPGRGICQRLKGKEGRFRGNLSGKRVDFSGRTVISPDPNCPVTEVVVPLFSAKRLTFPERVTSFNIQRLRECVRRGPDEWPGAVSILPKTGERRSLRYFNRRLAAQLLANGDVVERHCWNGDVVLFNRQPSLHRMSIMAHKARVMPWRTLRFNECVCSPYNADFDGDEMNCHLPQTQEARAEALHLMGVVNNLVTPKNGEPLVACTQDFLSGSYMICHKDVFLTRDKLCQFCCHFSDALYHIDLPPPTVLKPAELWTGKQLYNILLRPHGGAKTADGARSSGGAKLMLNFGLKERDYEKPKDGLPPFMCRKDGYILFYQGELMCGAVAKKTIGGGSKEGLFYYMIRDNTPTIAADCMCRISKLTGRWFANRGMTIGIDDVTPDERLKKAKAELIADGFKRVDEEIANYNSGKMEAAPGSTLDQTLEARSKGILDDLRSTAGELAMEQLHPLNKPLIMFLSGAKGAIINIAQMIALVGQQNVNGKRIWDGFVKRTLPHFPLDRNRTPQAKGFVGNSFYSGLTPQEFFFHTMSGREGLVDTAVKTAETGYMQRRLVKALEDLAVKYDGTVRTSDGQIVQFVYGDDGVAPIHCETKKVVMDLEKLMIQIRSLVRLDAGYLCEEYEGAFLRANDADRVGKAKRLRVAAGAGTGTARMAENPKAKRARGTTNEAEPEPEAEPEAEADAGADAEAEAEAGAQVASQIPSPWKALLSQTDIHTRFDTVLPPLDEASLFRHLRKHLEPVVAAARAGLPCSGRDPPAHSALPRSIRQKIQLLRNICKRAALLPGDDALTTLEAELAVLGDLLSGRSADLTSDEVFVAGRRQLLAHIAVYEWLPMHKRHAPLVPFELQRWADFLSEYCSEPLPKALQFAQAIALQQEPTHQSSTATVKLFSETVKAWIQDLVHNSASRRREQGENPMLTAEEYLQGLNEMVASTDSHTSSADRGNTTLRRATNPLDRRRFRPMVSGFYRASKSEWLTARHVLEFFRLAWRKYSKALIEPGEAVGAIGAQSIGEPGTQMTLKTFHFAGVASMNVTLGVPRIKEIINASANIMTPIIQVPLSRNREHQAFALMIKGRIERTYLGDVCKMIKQIYTEQDTSIEVRLAKVSIQKQYLNINAGVVKEAILRKGSLGKVKMTESQVQVTGEWRLSIHPPGGDGLSFQCRTIMTDLPKVIVSGLPTIKRGVVKVSKEPRTKGDPVDVFDLAVEGTGLLQIMTIEGVDYQRCMSNNVMEVKSVLGIEASRQTIINEIRGCMDAYSMDIDLRHMQLLGDVMSYRGEILGISRFGIEKMRASVLCLASFEQTNEHLFEAAVHRKTESVRGVSEAIILGQRVHQGTGAFDILHAPRNMPDHGGLHKKQTRKTFLMSQVMKQQTSLT